MACNEGGLYGAMFRRHGGRNSVRDSGVCEEERKEDVTEGCVVKLTTIFMHVFCI